jgi:hypothetical protein
VNIGSGWRTSTSPPAFGHLLSTMWRGECFGKKSWNIVGARRGVPGAQRRYGVASSLRTSGGISAASADGGSDTSLTSNPRGVVRQVR